MRRARPLLALLLVLAVVVPAAARPASAAGLDLLAGRGRVWASTDVRCQGAPVAVTTSTTSGAATTVRVTGVADACRDLPVVVSLGDPARGSARVFRGEGRATATTAVTGAAFTPSAQLVARVTVGGWPVPATWSWTPPAAPVGPVRPGTPGTTLSAVTWTLVTNNPVQACFTVAVTTTSTTPVVWRVDLDLNAAPFNGVTGGFQLGDVDGGNIAWRLQQRRDAAAHVWSISGRTDIAAGSRVATVVAGQTLRFSVCHWDLPPGVVTPGATTVEITPGRWTATQACQVVTIRGTGTSPFYVGYTFDLDMSAARGSVRRFLGWTNPTLDAWRFDRVDLGGDRFRFTSRTSANVAGTQTYRFEYCATGW